MPDPTPASDRPADQLRAAAEKLREEAARAHRAPPGPWAVADEHVVRCADGMIVADRSGTDHPAERADLRYIALMHPGVGLAVARWLESWAGVDLSEHGPMPEDAQHALAVARQLLGTTTAEDEPDVVAYRNTDRPGVLLCREHGEGWLGLTPLTSEDLEDGGFCTWGREYGHECGRDVLIAPTTSAASLGEVVSRLAAHAVGFQDVLDESDRGPWGALILADIAELRALANRPAADAAPPAPADRYRSAWGSARHRAAVLSAELTRRAPLLGEYAAENTRLLAQAVKAATTITRLRAERAELGRQLDCLRGDMRDMEACVREQDAEFERIRRAAGEAAAGVQQTITSDPLADCATEYRVPVPENGGTELRLRRGHAPYASGWSVAVPGYGGGMALTELGWSDSIGALSADRLFCWPDAATAVDAARRALPAAPAAPEERS
ncbi:hypothetical protein [Streptomyces sp. C3-3]|uniref:hypothetical protein n=1 Tax=Streptomyces sp. C3-3 TaxID=2824901 RepID=UPI001B392D9A|nr:hypothetical protein [Streptomyces sp. C3-3]MBQ1118500.1 hypothetical protein [Streptomyces sp. C3-3]